MLVYVCSPYSGDIERNVKFARKACRQIVEEGNTPIAPHLLLPQFMSEEAEREQAISMNMEILESCDYMHVFTYDGLTEGMRKEIQKAQELNMHILLTGEF